MANRRDIQFLANPHNRAALLDCSFTVAAANANGFGITGLNKSGRIATVFMHTSQTPGKASNGQTNPNPASGLIQVTLQDNYQSVLGIESNFVAPLSGSSISISTASSLTVGNIYVITALGTSTQANWQAVGLPSNIQAAVGVSFIASATSGTGTGTVQAPAAAGTGVDHIEVVGSLASMGNQSAASNMNNNNVGSILGFGVGLQLNLACYKNTVLTAPTDGAMIYLRIYVSNSAQGV